MLPPPRATSAPRSARRRLTALTALALAALTLGAAPAPSDGPGARPAPSRRGARAPVSQLRGARWGSVPLR